MSPTAVRPNYRELADTAIAKRNATIPAKWQLPKSCYPLPLDSTTLLEKSGLLDATELEIIRLSATKLASAIKNGTYSSVKVTTAFCKAAAIAQQATNCLTELFVDEALERAKWCDEQLAAGKEVGLLHGVPISIKDHIDIQGHDSPSGFLGLVGKMVAKEDAHLVAALRNAGAVFYCKTTNPQGIMHLENECYLGTTLCPYNRNLTSGGSSGGEGATIGMFASPLGVGSDIGGSVRSPAAACGIFSFKPTVGRLSFHGCQAPHFTKGYEGILGTHAPMARDVEDLDLYMKIQVDSKIWEKDPTLWVKHWVTPERPNRPLRVGVMKDDGVVRPVAPIRRAMESVVAKLKANPNFEVVEFAPWQSEAAWDIISQLYWCHDGGEGTFKYMALGDEPVHPLTQWSIDQSRCEGKTLPADDYYKLVGRRDDFRAGLAEHWRAQGVDVVLSPVGPSPAPPHRTSKYWNYTSFWNLANYPAAVFPTGLHVEETDVEDYTPRNADEKAVRETYDPKVSIRAPLTLQLIGYIGHDEETVQALKDVMAQLRS